MTETLTPVTFETEPQVVDEQLERLGKQFDLNITEADEDMLCALGLDRLPRGIAIIGGAARSILQYSRFGEQAQIRDIDLVAIQGLTEEDCDLKDLSRRYMEDDYRFGHGVKTEPLDMYFATRDFTINEVMVLDGKIVSTVQGSRDLQDKVIRASEYESRGNYIGPKLKLKAKLLAAVFDVAYGHASDETPQVYSTDSGDFYYALMLNKAFQYGKEVTERFLMRLGVGPLDDLYQEAVSDAIEYADADGYFRFRGSDIAEEIMNNVRRNNPGHDVDEGVSTGYSRSEEHAIELMRRFGGRLSRATLKEY